MEEKNTIEEIKKLLAEYNEYAAANGFKVNPNTQIAENIVKALLLREETLGERYCPCRRATGNTEEDKKIICPCVYHKEEIEKDKHCHCNLFVKAE